MTGLEFPASLIDSVNRDRNPGRRAWLAALPGILSRLARQWGLRLETPFQPGGDCSWVGPVRAMDGRQLVLKAGWLHAEAMHEADALRCWDRRGAVAVYAEDVFDDTIALLLGRCMPGTPLRQVPEPEQDAVVCTLLRRLWRAPPARHAFPSLQAMCDRWADRFDQQASRAAQRLDPGIARAGMELFRTLPATAGEHVLLVTDLHAGTSCLAADGNRAARAPRHRALSPPGIATWLLGQAAGWLRPAQVSGPGAARRTPPAPGAPGSARHP